VNGIITAWNHGDRAVRTCQPSSVRAWRTR
jgi:hypothetical protein